MSKYGAGSVDPTETDENKGIMSGLNKNQVVMHAPSLDFVKFLPAAYEAVTNNPDWDWMEQMLFWTTLIIQINIIGRGCEVCEFCPKVENVKYPTDAHEFDQDGYPHWIEVNLHEWKGHKKTGELYPLKLWRNRMHAYLDPVFLLTHWLAVSGIVSGPIFTNLMSTSNGASTVKVPLVATQEVKVLDSKGSEMSVSQDASGNIVNMSVDMWSDVLSTIFALTRYFKASPHSIRRSAAQWAARCGAESYQIQNAGRWNKDSTSWRTYVAAGEQESARFLDRLDPIRELW
eukprot:CAMPEP_0119038332 /NCGR_PEP_ID=MMETSP1177-20130426/7187_1 /TAXON_ID=2985 /ORGANISM="Ochromonas sp, Strain CCMP1899" /LENGTH=287 /DNA_ID=CAMNT_0007000779 /DNA_START=332 /DNA_END=1192 /DNA_ORIENTATION=-